MQNKFITESVGLPASCRASRASRLKGRVLNALTIIAVGCVVSCNANPGDRRASQRERLNEMRAEADKAYETERDACTNDHPPGQDRANCFNKAQKRYQDANAAIDDANVKMLLRDADCPKPNSARYGKH